MNKEFKVVVNVKEYEDEPVNLANLVEDTLRDELKSMECDGTIEGFTLEVEEVENHRRCYGCDGKGVGLDWGAMNFWECDVCKGTGELEGEDDGE